MKLYWSVLTLTFQWTLTSAEPQPDVGHVFLYDPQGNLEAPSDQHQTVFLESARLIIAERLWLSSFYSLGDLSEDAIRQVNMFSGRRRDVFTSVEGDEPEHAMLVVEGVKNAEDFWPREHKGWSRFQISQIPSALENRRFLDRLQSQADSLYPEGSKGSTEMNTIVENLRFWRSNEDELLTTSGPLTFRHIHTLQKYYNDPKGTYTSMSENLKLHIERAVRTAKSKKVSLTILIMPPTTQQREKRSAVSWRNFEAENIPRFEHAAETVLSSARPSLTRPAASNSSIPSGPVRGILPSCFPTELECIKTTHACSGHGKCILKRKAVKGQDISDCFACACEPEKVKDGKKTVSYGGPACQKKSVVVPFWLLVGTSIALITVVSMGIGLLFGMGNEELPSVIGAGVSGPRAK